jgi:DNA polymerase-3 subunit alpha
VERFRNSNNYELRIQNVEQLFDVKEKRLEKITIHLDMARLDMEMVADLTSLLQDHPGTTELYIQLKTAESQNNILMRSRNMRVSVDKRLIMALDSTENLSYSIN